MLSNMRAGGKLRRKPLQNKMHIANPVFGKRQQGITRSICIAASGRVREVDVIAGNPAAGIATMPGITNIPGYLGVFMAGINPNAIKRAQLECRKEERIFLHKLDIGPGQHILSMDEKTLTAFIIVSAVRTNKNRIMIRKIHGDNFRIRKKDG